MITLEIKVDEKKGSAGRSDAKESSIEEIAMMIAMLNKYMRKMQGQFDKLADVESITEDIEFKEKN